MCLCIQHLLPNIINECGMWNVFQSVTTACHLTIFLSTIIFMCLVLLLFVTWVDDYKRVPLLFLNQELISYGYSSYRFCYCCSSSCWGDPLQKSLRLLCFKLDWDEIWRDCYSSKYASIERVRLSCDLILSRCLPWHHFAHKSAAIWWLHMQCLPATCTAASASSWSILHLYLLCQVWQV